MQFQREADGQEFGGTPADFKNRCYTFLDVLCNDKNLDRAARYLHPDCVMIHADNPPVHGSSAFLGAWGANLEKMPDYHKDVRDIIVELGGPSEAARVWVYSRISGINGDSLTDSIDMMHFTADGLFLDSKDVQRPLGKPDATG